MALGSTQPLTKMTTRCIRLTTLSPSCVVMKLGTLTSWNLLGQSRLVTGLIYRHCEHCVLLSFDCSGHGPVLGCSDHCNERLDFIKVWKFLHQVSRRSLQHRVRWLVSWLVAWLITALILLDAYSKVI